jgi:hypothetical protein
LQIKVYVKELHAYLTSGAQLITLELVKLFILYLARTSSGMLEERITARTVRNYIAHTLSALYRSTGQKQLAQEDRAQVHTYIASLEYAGELSAKARVKPVATKNDLDLLLESVFSEVYSIKVLSIRVVLNLALYMNLYVDVCGHGSALAWGGPSVAEAENHCASLSL